MPALEKLRFFTFDGVITMTGFIFFIFILINMDMSSDEALPLGLAWEFALLFYGTIMVTYCVGGFSADGPGWGS
jgi:hypothetical protein